MDFRRLTAPCGLDCFNCAMYRASLDEETRKKVAKAMNLPLEKAQCKGCRDEEGTIGFLGMTEPCRAYKCSRAKGVEFCSDCADFPCDFLHPYADMASQRPHNTKVFNLCLIKKMGVEQWAKEKAKGVRETYFKGKFTL